MTTLKKSRFGFVLVAAFVAAVVGSASARTIAVAPGPGTPLQDAIDAAAPGDTLLLGEGRFLEAVVVDKALHIKAEGALVDARCAAPVAVTIAAGRVRISGGVVTGGTDAEIAVSGQSRVEVKGARLEPTCVGVADGIRVIGGDQVKIHRVEMHAPPTMYANAFVVVSGIQANARVRVERNFSNAANGHGIIVDASTDDGGGRYGVRVRSNRVLSSGIGILVRGSDHVRVQANVVGSSTGAGIAVDAGSSNNLLQGNTSTGNHPDVLDAGTGNCWKRNEFVLGSVAPCS